MTKRTLTTVILALLVAAAPVMATDFIVNFGLVSGTPDITSYGCGAGCPGNPYGPLSGVTFSYNPPSGSPEDAVIGTLGVEGTSLSDTAFLTGGLHLVFTSAVYGLSFTYKVWDGPTYSGNLVNDVGVGFDSIVPSVSDVTGTFSYASPTSFTTADVQFNNSLDAGRSFLVDSVTYSDTEVPEPGTIALMAFGLLGLGGLRRLRRRA